MVSRLDNRKAAVNNFAVIDLALHGSRERQEGLLGQTTRTLERLELDVKGVRRGFRRSPRGKGEHPHLHDIMAWMDDIVNTPQYAEDIDFLKKLHVTLLGRVG